LGSQGVLCGAAVVSSGGQHLWGGAPAKEVPWRDDQRAGWPGALGVPEVGQVSCRVVVFMDQAAEDITAAELSGDQRLRLAIVL
jgi:hypothetical protein